MDKLTYRNSRTDFEKYALNMIMNQIDEFTNEDIFKELKYACDESVANDFIIDIVCTAIEFCLNEGYVDIYDKQSYIINLTKQEEFLNFTKKFNNDCYLL